MLNRFPFALIVVLLFVEATPPAEAFPVPATSSLPGSPDDSSAFILVRKGKGHGDGEERFERHRRREAHGFARYRRDSRGLHGNRGFGIYSGSRGGHQNQPDGQN